MLNWFIRKRIAAFERTYDYDTAYMREMLDISPKGFMRFAKVMELSQYNEDAPVDARFAAKLAATLEEDCGPCTQLVVKMAEQAGVSASVLRGIISGDEKLMSADAALAYRYARAAMAHALETDEFRQQIEQRWGRRAVLTLALAITSSRMYPTLKYALGHGHACTRVRVGDVDVAPHAVPA